MSYPETPSLPLLTPIARRNCSDCNFHLGTFFKGLSLPVAEDGLSSFIELELRLTFFFFLDFNIGFKSNF